MKENKCLFPEVSGMETCEAEGYPFGDFGIFACCKGHSLKVSVLEAMVALTDLYINPDTPLSSKQEGILEGLKRRGVATRVSDTDYRRSGGFTLFGPDLLEMYKSSVE